MTNTERIKELEKKLDLFEYWWGNWWGYNKPRNYTPDPEAIVEKELSKYHNPADVERITGLGVVIRDLTHDKSSLSETCVRSAERIADMEKELAVSKDEATEWAKFAGVLQTKVMDLENERDDPLKKSGWQTSCEMAEERIAELEAVIKQRDEHLTERWQRIGELERDLHGAKMHSSATLADLNRLDTELDETKEERKKWYDKYMMMKEKIADKCKECPINHL